MNRDLQQIASALGESQEASRAALVDLLARDADGRLARRHRSASALALRASKLDLGGDEPALASWRRRLRSVSAQQMHLESAMTDMAGALGDDLSWTPIKGMDLCSRVYDPAEERPTSDLDILVSVDDFDLARQRLQSAGWQPLNAGRRSEDYLRQEGYAWQARNAHGALLELHYRLWGLVTVETASAFVAGAEPDAGLPGSGCRLRLSHAFMLAAVHLWLDSAPRAAGNFRDLERIGRIGPPSLAEEIIVETERLDLQLPVYLAARVAHRLWSEQICTHVANGLGSSLRMPERLWIGRLNDPSAARLSHMVLCRHLSRRQSRHGLGLSLWRRLWSHPGIVESATDEHWPWTARRIWYQLLASGQTRLAGWFARWMQHRFHPKDLDSSRDRSGDSREREPRATL